MILKVEKRDTRKRKFEPKHIYDAIEAAFKESHEQYCDETLDDLVSKVIASLELLGKKTVPVETIQDTIEKVLMEEGYYKTAKDFIEYRANRTRIRSLKTDGLNKILREIIATNLKTSALLRDNGNVNGALVASSYAKAGGEAMKLYNTVELIRPEIARAHKMGLMHIHDLDYYSLTVNCFFIPLAKLLKEGYDSGMGWTRPAHSIETACQLAAIVLQTSQNAFFGGQAYANFDFDLAPYVDWSFQKNVKKELRSLYKYSHDQALAGFIAKYDFRIIDDATGEYDNFECGREPLPWFHFDDIDHKYDIEGWEIPKDVIDEALTMTYRNTKQGLESFIHNVNGLFSRSGNQLPFSSVNFGLDTSLSGRLISHALLDATQAGIGNGATAIFPISILKMMSGYTANPEDPNYDLFLRATEVCAERFYPNYVDVDADFNEAYVKYETETIDNPKDTDFVMFRGTQFYRKAPGEYWRIDKRTDNQVTIKRVIPETTISTMGCRTRSIGNVNGPSVTTGKGNLWFTTLNLPAIALEAIKEAEPMEAFWRILDERMQMARTCMEDRYDWIKHRCYDNLYFPMANGLYIGSDKNDPKDTPIEKAIKNGSSAIGYIGIYETVLALTGKVYGFEKDATELGYQIVKHIRAYTDAVQKETHMNWTTFATPAENVCGRFAELGKSVFGKDKVLAKKMMTERIAVKVLEDVMLHDRKTGEEVVMDAQEYLADMTEFNKKYWLVAYDHEYDVTDYKNGWLYIERTAPIVDILFDKGYLTNSHMVPFELPISLSDKIAVEAPFHKLANGGHIFYYKIDGDAAKNVEAVRAAIKAMHNGNLGYYCCTFDQDTCRKCGYRGIIHDKCPKCGGTNILRIRRITGYLVGRSSQGIEESWCNGKRNELKHRGNI